MRQLAVMSSGSAEPGLDRVAEVFRAQTGIEVVITYNKEVADPDVIVASRNAMSRKYFASRQVSNEGVCIGRSGMGAAVRKAAWTPDISTLQNLLRTVRDADAILLTDNHTTGIYMEGLFQKLGLESDIGHKIERCFNGPVTMERLLNFAGKAVTFLSMNEIRTYEGKGLINLGPLPPGAQYEREFVVAVATRSAQSEFANAFVKFCGGSGRKILENYGFKQD